jgi:hypothetical protein
MQLDSSIINMLLCCRFNSKDFENGYSRNLLWRLWHAARLFKLKHLFDLCSEVSYMMVFYHRVGRLLSFFSSRRNWDSPNPSPQASVPPPPMFVGRGTLAGERGVGRVPISKRGHTLWYSLKICTLWFLSKLP